MPTFRSSAIFCSEFPGSLDILTQLKARGDVADVYRKFYETPYFNLLSPESYLLAPMQRVSKFFVVFRGIIHATPEDHPDYDAVKRASRAAADVLEYINTECGTAQEAERLKKVQQKLNIDLQSEIGEDTLSLHARQLLSDQEMGYGNESKRVMVYMFNDTILIVSVRGKGEKVVLHKAVKKDLLQVRAQSDSN